MKFFLERRKAPWKKMGMHGIAQPQSAAGASFFLCLVAHHLRAAGWFFLKDHFFG